MECFEKEKTSSCLQRMLSLIRTKQSIGSNNDWSRQYWSQLQTQIVQAESATSIAASIRCC